MKYYRCQCCGESSAEDDIHLRFISPAYPSEPVCPCCGSMRGFEFDEVNSDEEESDD